MQIEILKDHTVQKTFSFKSNTHSQLNENEFIGSGYAGRMDVSGLRANVSRANVACGHWLSLLLLS